MRRWRADGIGERAIEMHQRFGADTTHADQDILNHVFAGRWTPLPEKWNKMIEHPVLGKFGAGRLDELTRQEGMVHYVGAVKPWQDGFPDNPPPAHVRAVRRRPGKGPGGLTPSGPSSRNAHRLRRHLWRTPRSNPKNPSPGERALRARGPRRPPGRAAPSTAWFPPDPAP
ncbi:hypothetical protein E1193_10485 [Micromonospora sp. KC606]|nr:hypothetical protein E1193_10485 [Micromonospora sp. KC606]